MLTDHDGTADPTQSRALRSLSSKNISQFIALTLLTIPVVAVVLLHYDHLLTADREWKYIWGRNGDRSMATFFILNRHLPYPVAALTCLRLFANMGSKFCAAIERTLMFCLLFALIAGESVVVWSTLKRFCAKRRKVAFGIWFLCFTLACGTVPLIDTKHKSFVASSCFVTGKDRIIFAIYILSAISEAGLFLAMFRSSWSASRRTKLPLAKDLLRNDFFFYACKPILNMLFISFIKAIDGAVIVDIAMTLHTVVRSILSSRFALGIAAPKQDADSDYEDDCSVIDPSDSE